MYAGENELCDCIIDKFLEYPAIMGTANVGTLKLFSSRCAEYEKFKVFFQIRLTVTRVVIQSLR